MSSQQSTAPSNQVNDVDMQDSGRPSRRENEALPPPNAQPERLNTRGDQEPPPFSFVFSRDFAAILAALAPQNPSSQPASAAIIHPGMSEDAVRSVALQDPTSEEPTRWQVLARTGYMFTIHRAFHRSGETGPTCPGCALFASHLFGTTHYPPPDVPLSEVRRNLVDAWPELVEQLIAEGYQRCMDKYGIPPDKKEDRLAIPPADPSPSHPLRRNRDHDDDYDDRRPPKPRQERSHYTPYPQSSSSAPRDRDRGYPGQHDSKYRARAGPSTSPSESASPLAPSSHAHPPPMGSWGSSTGGWTDATPSPSWSDTNEGSSSRDRTGRPDPLLLSRRRGGRSPPRSTPHRPSRPIGTADVRNPKENMALHAALCVHPTQRSRQQQNFVDSYRTFLSLSTDGNEKDPAVWAMRDCTLPFTFDHHSTLCSWEQSVNQAPHWVLPSQGNLFDSRLLEIALWVCIAIPDKLSKGEPTLDARIRRREHRLNLAWIIVQIFADGPGRVHQALVDLRIDLAGDVDPGTGQPRLLTDGAKPLEFYTEDPVRTAVCAAAALPWILTHRMVSEPMLMRLCAGASLIRPWMVKEGIDPISQKEWDDTWPVIAARTHATEGPSIGAPISATNDPALPSIHMEVEDVTNPPAPIAPNPPVPEAAAPPPVATLPGPSVVVDTVVPYHHQTEEYDFDEDQAYDEYPDHSLIQSKDMIPVWRGHASFRDVALFNYYQHHSGMNKEPTLTTFIYQPDSGDRPIVHPGWKYNPHPYRDPSTQTGWITRKEDYGPYKDYWEWLDGHPQRLIPNYVEDDYTLRSIGGLTTPPNQQPRRIKDKGKARQKRS
jgi:hypothetical protein